MSKEKISSQEIIDQVSLKASVSKRAAEEFLKVMISTIEEALVDGEVVKIKGFGTFKLQWNEPRKSVNVQTGDEIVLDGYHKVTFTPEVSLKDLVNEPFAHLEPVLLDADNNFVVPDEPVVVNVSQDPLRVFTEQASEINDLLAELRAMSAPIVEDEDEEADELTEGYLSDDYLANEIKEDVPEKKYTRTVSLQAEYVFDDDGPLYDEEIDGESAVAPLEQQPVDREEESESEKVEETQTEQQDKIFLEEVHPVNESEDFESDYEPVMVLPLVDEAEEEELFGTIRPVDDLSSEQNNIKSDLEEKEIVPAFEVIRQINEQSARSVAESQIEGEFTEVKSAIDEVYSTETVVPEPSLVDDEPFVYKPRVLVEDADKPRVVYERNDDELDLEKTPFMQGVRKKRRKTTFWVAFIIVFLLMVVGTFVLYTLYSPVTTFVNEQLGVQPARVTIKVPHKPKSTPKVAKIVVIPKDTTKKDTFKVDEKTAKAGKVKQVVDTLQQLFDKRNYDIRLASEQLKKDSKLTSIALKYYGHKDFWVYIYDSNRDKIDDPEHLLSGTLIRIPKLDKKLIDPKNPKCLSKAKELATKYLPGKELK